ncbi:MAG: MerR family transcriptional regulator [Patescibacteria group bacterium]
MPYWVKEVAGMAGISVRALHHYDRIGLLKPEAVTPSGYRQYSDRDLQRLQQILFFREIGFNLEEIRGILDRPDFDRGRALRAHRELLTEKKRRLEEIIRTVDRTLKAMEEGRSMEKKEMFEGFDMAEIEKHQAKYADEVRQKYDPKVVAECERKTARYTKEDWAAILARGNEIYRRIADAMERGPADPEVQAAVTEWREHITNSFYACTPEIFRGLGDLYVNDHRFTENIDKVKPGLAAFLREAMHVYCDRLGE